MFRMHMHIMYVPYGGVVKVVCMCTYAYMCVVQALPFCSKRTHSIVREHILYYIQRKYSIPDDVLYKVCHSVVKHEHSIVREHILYYIKRTHSIPAEVLYKVCHSVVKEHILW